MIGLAEIAASIAPVAGGLLIGVAAGYLITPDIRGSIKQDLELLNVLPPEQAGRRAELQRSIDIRIDGLIAAVDRYQPLQKKWPPIVATCATSGSSPSWCCSPWSGGASITTGAAGYRCSLC